MNDFPGLQGVIASLRDDLERQAPPPLPPAALAALQARQARQAATAVAAAPAAARSWPAAWVRSPRQRAAQGAAQRATPGSTPWRAWPGAAACVALILLSVLLMWQPRRAEERAPVASAAPDPADPAGAGSAFVPLVPTERLVALTQAPQNPAWLISTELPQQRLAQFGLPYDPEHAAQPQRAQLLVAPSGEVLAVRLLQ